MIVDSSALIGILRKEPEADVLMRKLVGAPIVRISAASYLEAAIVVDAERDPVKSRRFDEFLNDGEIAIASVSEAQARLAREAYRDYGKGSGHPARLNFGACFSYALAKELGEPLLFKGDDFSKTDVEPA